LNNLKLVRKDGFHRELNLFYEKTVGGILFSDNIFYYNKEIDVLKNNKSINYQAIHNAKKYFSGFVIK